jgi:hypothetical protein
VSFRVETWTAQRSSLPALSVICQGHREYCNTPCFVSSTHQFLLFLTRNSFVSNGTHRCSRSPLNAVLIIVRCVIPCSCDCRALVFVEYCVTPIYLPTLSSIPMSHTPFFTISYREYFCFRCHTPFYTVSYREELCFRCK